jgi:hypothetical protein
MESGNATLPSHVTKSGASDFLPVIVDYKDKKGRKPGM